MHTRSEPRFHVQSAVKVAAVDQPEEVSAAVLLDVSGSGMKIISDHDWPVGARLVVEMENHLVLARVRNSQARGPKFSLGAETLHSTLKLMLPDAPRAEWHKILLEEAGDTREPAVTSSDAAAAPEAESEEFWNKPEPPWTETTLAELDEGTSDSANRTAADEPIPGEAAPMASSLHAPEPAASAHDAEPLDERALDAQTLALLTRDLQALDREEHPQDAATHEQISSPDAAQTDVDSAAQSESGSRTDSMPMSHTDSAEEARVLEAGRSRPGYTARAPAKTHHTQRVQARKRTPQEAEPP